MKRIKYELSTLLGLNFSKTQCPTPYLARNALGEKLSVGEAFVGSCFCMTCKEFIKKTATTVYCKAGE